MTKGLGYNLKHDVLAELEWDPSVDASKIGVSIEGDVVTLTGHVRSYSEKWDAEQIVKRVHGVRAVANDIKIGLDLKDEKDDTEIARSAVNALNWHFSIPKDAVTVTVGNGYLTLDGEVEWNYQKRSAEEAVRRLRGIKGVNNQIKIRQHAQAGDVKQKIEAALRRNAELDAKKIIVETSDGSVTLTGNVRSWVEREDAVNAAWAAPGVTKVVDKILIHA